MRMAVNSRRMSVPRSDVWSSLSDGHVYSDWVVGTSHIRTVDPHWPAPGARLYYSIGRGRLRYDGHTEVLAADPGRRLELEAHAWPLGTMRIELRLIDDGDGTCVVMVERPARGAWAPLHNRAGDLLLSLRNKEALRRLERLVQP